MDGLVTDVSGERPIRNAPRNRKAPPVNDPQRIDALFSTRLKDLYARAGRPDLATLTRHAASQQPPVDLPDATVNDWLSGKSIPSAGKHDQLRVLVTILERTAGTQTETELRRRAGEWVRLADSARRARTTQARKSTTVGDTTVDRLGRPILDCDPFHLEVHPAIHIPGTDLDPLPPYLPRAHDTQLRQAADHVLETRVSRLTTLIAGSSTGKTRACWELAQHIEARAPGQWRLWHPYDPTRPEAALADLENAGPHTIVWLNEAQHYLMSTSTTAGERIAAGLRTLLYDPQRRPILVLATMWPTHWNTLTAQPAAGNPDPYAQARTVLLSGTTITITGTFSPADLAALDKPTADPRLREAAAYAEDGRITQYLAGAPDLEYRHRTAPPAARAIIELSMDARRLGHPLHLPHALLESAAHGYLTDREWDHPGGDEDWGDDWLERALAYTAHPCKGAHGPLRRIRTRPDTITAQQPHYRLADYLEQAGRRERAGMYPPESLWAALATTVTDPALLRHLGREARARGRYQHAVWLYQSAADRGDIDVLTDLAELREHVGDREGAERVAIQAADRGSNDALLTLAELREWSGDRAGAEALAALGADCGDPDALTRLAWVREQSGNRQGAEQLYQQAADRGSTNALLSLAELRERAGDRKEAEALATQAADHGDPDALTSLAWLREETGDGQDAAQLYQRAADRGDPHALRRLAELQEAYGNQERAEALYQRAADRGDIGALLSLAERRNQAGDRTGAEELIVQATDRGGLGALTILAEMRERAGDRQGAEALVVQAADRGDSTALESLAAARDRAGDRKSAEALAIQAANLGNTTALMHLAWRRTKGDDQEGAEALYQQAVDHGCIDALLGLAELRETAGERESAEALCQQAVDQGHIDALLVLAQLRRKAGDRESAEALYRQAASHGCLAALPALADVREDFGDREGADRIRRFGLTGAGQPAPGLDFSS